MRILLSVIFILLCVGNAYAQRDFSNIEIKTTLVSDSIYMLEGSGGNIAISVGDDGVLMIDDQFAELNEKIMDAITALTDRDVEFVLNTHWHADHTGGNTVMHEHGAHIIAHTNVRHRLSTKQIRTSTGQEYEPKPNEALPVLTYGDGVTFYFNAQTIEVKHLGPAHTDGDSIIFFKEANVIHMGDNMFSGRFPFIDLDSGGSVEGYLRNVEAVLGMIDEDTKIIPGHGPLSSREDLKRFRDMLVYFSDYVKGAISEGETLAEIQAMDIPEEYSTWGTDFIKTDRWLATLFKNYN